MAGAAAVLGTSAALVHEPWLATGVIVGGSLVAATLLWPLETVGVMLALGPLDLSFLTGGFKELFPELGGLDMNGIRLVGMVIGLSAVVVSDRAVLRRAVGPYGRWYLIFLVYAAATLAMSWSLLDGLRLLLKLAYPFLIFVVVLGVARSREEVTRLADWALVGALVLTVVLNPIFVATGGYEVDLAGRIRVQGAGLHENPFSFYLVVMLLVVAVRFAVRGQVRYLMLGLLLVGWLALTLTRISLAAGVAGLVGMGAYGVWARRDYRVAVGAGVLALVVAAAMTPVVLERTFGTVPSLEELYRLLRDPALLYERMNWQGRELFWPVVFQAFTTSPIVGLGLGTSTAIMVASFPTSWATVVHNEYLRLAAEAGLVGVGLYALAVTRWGVGVVRAGHAQAAAVREFALPALGALVAWAIIAITDNAFDYYAPLTQFVAFLAAGAVVCGEAG